ncbi:MAG: molybdenum hydroxylase, partial [Candidatus Bathyarchaeota archaeon]|nr:molybdenum hydroxylase [Candidatus Bathyarchaeota archaeon]
MSKPSVLIKGAGDVATGVAYILNQEGMDIVMTEIDRPTTERRGASFSETIYSNEITVDGLTAKKTNFDNYVKILEDGKIPVVVDPKTELLDKIKPEILVDA